MRLDISSFFGNSGSGKGFGFINLRDYASIKNGSYNKLMKAYYKPEKEEKITSSAGTDKPEKTTKKQSVDATGLTQMKKDADSLKSAAEALSDSKLWEQSEGKYDVDKIAGAVKDFVAKYNAALEQSGKATGKEVAQTTGYMTSMTNTMAKSLAKSGIAVGVDGKLSLNEDALKKSDVNSIKTLFAGSYSYGGQIADKASQLSRDALMGGGTYSRKGSFSSSLAGMFDNWI